RTAFSPSCRCSTRTPGASPMPPPCWGPSKSLPTDSSIRSASPSSSGMRRLPLAPAYPASGSPCSSTSTRPGPTCTACACSSPVAAVATIKSAMKDTDPKAIRLKQGLPLAGVELRLADVDSGTPVAWDGKSVGEIQVRGPWVTAGYYRGVDADRFTADGWLRTGDVANVDSEGYAQIVDRTKDLVKSGGEWIS